MTLISATSGQSQALEIETDSAALNLKSSEVQMLAWSCVDGEKQDMHSFILPTFLPWVPQGPSWGEEKGSPQQTLIITGQEVLKLGLKYFAFFLCEST